MAMFAAATPLTIDESQTARVNGHVFTLATNLGMARDWQICMRCGKVRYACIAVPCAGHQERRAKS